MKDPVSFARSEAPLVSVIIPSYNKRNYIVDTIASVQAQTYGNWELLVVDDVSTDGSVDLLREIAKHDPRITVDVLDKNSGANRCRNYGLAKAKGHYVIFLDADDQLAPHCLGTRVSAMKRTKDPDMGVFTLRVFRHRLGDDTRRWIPKHRKPLRDFFRHDLPWQTMQPIWKKEFIKQLGGFDEGFARHQDVELHTRALMLPSVRVEQFPGPIDCYYRVGEERRTDGIARRSEKLVDATLHYYERFMPDADRLGMRSALIGTLHRIQLQLLYHGREEHISKAELVQLEKRLFPQEIWRSIPIWKRFLFRVSRIFNMAPFRIPGVNRTIGALLVR